MKPERNDPCPCGSGKKYKKCCGKAGARPVAVPAAGVDPFQRAHVAYKRGAYDEANDACTVALGDFPEHPDTNHLCGLVSYRLGRFQQARARLEKAARLAPDNALAWSNLSLAQRDAGDLNAAEFSARRALDLDAQMAEAHLNLGTVLRKKGDLDGARAAFQRAVELEARNPEYLSKLGWTLLLQDRLVDAESTLRRALGIAQNFPHALVGMCELRLRQGRRDEVRAFLEQAFACASDDAVFWDALGSIYLKLKDPKGALDCYRRALAIHPEYADAYHNLGCAFWDLGDKGNAFQAYEYVIKFGHGTMDDYYSLFMAASYIGRADAVYADAIRLLDETNVPARLLTMIIDVLGLACGFAARQRAWRRLMAAVAKESPDELTLGPGLMPSGYEYSLDEESIIRFHRLWGEKVEARVGNGQFRPTRRESSKLRVGYLSPDFCNHSVGYFIQHVLPAHDRGQFEIFCYSLTCKEDEVTALLRGSVDRFIDVRHLEEAEIAGRIREDGVQVLIDLAGHTDGGRPAVLAHRPAPVQCGWVGYLNTIGLKAVDYRITDPHADDPATWRGTEKLLVLPESFLCFGQFPETEIDPLPACERNGYVTFASFNNLMKITAEAVRLWALVLTSVPDSRMLVMALGADAGIARNNLCAEFARHGIGPERLLLRKPVSRDQYFHAHNEVDIILDTFPFNGGTITAGALWMGVPVVTRVGAVHRQRVSYSMLRNIGVEETIAWSEDEYVAAAGRLARDPRALAGLRQRIARNTRASILCDAPRFTRQLEAALQRVWGEYCAGSGQ